MPASSPLSLMTGTRRTPRARMRWAVSKTVSLSSITAKIAFPVSVGIRKYYLGIDRLDASLFVISIAIAMGLIWAHRSNIRRLLDGTENRVGSFRPARGMIGKGELQE